MQVWNPEDAEDEVLAMVCRTGLNTQMGSMVRELVTPTTLSARKDAFVKVSNPRPASSNPRPASSNFRHAVSNPRHAVSNPRQAVSSPGPACSNPWRASSNAVMLHNVIFDAVMLDAVLWLMLCCVCAVPCCAMLRSALPGCAASRCAVPCYPCCAVPCCPCCAVPRCPCCALPCCAILRCTVLLCYAMMRYAALCHHAMLPVMLSVAGLALWYQLSDPSCLASM